MTRHQAIVLLQKALDSARNDYAIDRPDVELGVMIVARAMARFYVPSISVSGPDEKRDAFIREVRSS